MELFHGPTLAFKDIALQLVGRLFDHELARRGERVTIVGATSGDTGSAAIEACRDRDSLDIFVLHPHGRVTEVQRRQMTTVPSSNVHNIAVEGSFDDCQDLVKAMFADEAFRRRHRLAAVNSINFARVMAQIVYYVVAAQVLGGSSGNGRPVGFAVPTGNFGNVYAGYAAHRMGLDVSQLVVGSNTNDILTRFFASAHLEIREVVPTMSPSMDIQVSSNLERLLFELLGRDGAATAALLEGFRASGEADLPPPAAAGLAPLWSGARVDEAATLSGHRRRAPPHGDDDRSAHGGRRGSGGGPPGATRMCRWWCSPRRTRRSSPTPWRRRAGGVPRCPSGSPTWPSARSAAPCSTTISGRCSATWRRTPASTVIGERGAGVKYVVCIPDGCADEPVPALEGRTPLEVAHMPTLASLAARGTLGRARVIPEGLPAGSDVGNMSILGYDPARYHSGRASIEAAAMGLHLAGDQVAYRCNLATVAGGTMVDFAGGHPSTGEAAGVISALQAELGGEVSFHAGVQYRHIMSRSRCLGRSGLRPPARHHRPGGGAADGSGGTAAPVADGGLA